MQNPNKQCKVIFKYGSTNQRPNAVCKVDRNDIETTSGFVCLLELYILATSKIICRWILPCVSVHSWFLYSAAPLGDQTTIQHHDPISHQSHYPDVELTSLFHILIMLSASPGSNKCQVCKSLDCLNPKSNALDLPHEKPTFYRFSHRIQ